MAAEDNRLAHFRAKVEELSPKGRDGSRDLSVGYHAVADDTGLTYAYVYQVYKGKSGKHGLGKRAATRFAEVYGKGRPDGWIDLPPDAGAPAGGLSEEFQPVRRADVAFSNGVGRMVYEEDQKPPLVFRTDFLRKLGITQGNAVVVDADGNSNYPKILDGAVVLVNRGDAERLDGDFFAFRYEGELLIKRLERLKDIGVLATAENPDFRPKTKVYKGADLEALEVIGRAVWMGAVL